MVNSGTGAHLWGKSFHPEGKGKGQPEDIRSSFESLLSLWSSQSPRDARGLGDLWPECLSARGIHLSRRDFYIFPYTLLLLAFSGYDQKMTKNGNVCTSSLGSTV